MENQVYGVSIDPDPCPDAPLVRQGWKRNRRPPREGPVNLGRTKYGL